MFGSMLTDAGFGLAALIAVLSGMLSFLSPCVLPLVPPYLAYMGGISMGELTGRTAPRRSVVLPALFFVLGLSTVFLFVGFAASSFGRAFLPWLPWLNRAFGVLVMVLGLHFLHVIRIPALDREARFEARRQDGSAFGAYLLGLAFAFGWTPCIGPQLSAILSLAMAEASMARGTALLGLYAAGLGIPFLLAALFITRSMALMNRLKPHMGRIERAMGALLLLVGLALVTNLFARFSYWLLELFPGLAALG